MKKSTCIIGMLFIYSTTNSQYREMVPNGGFEYGGNLGCGYTNISDYNIANWSPALGAFTWWDWNQYRTSPSCYLSIEGLSVPQGDIYPPTINTSPRCIGLVPNGTQGICMCDNSINGGVCSTAAITALNYPLRSFGQGAVYKLTFQAAWSPQQTDFPLSSEVKIHFTSASPGVTYSSTCISDVNWQSSTPSLELDFPLNIDPSVESQWQSFEEYFEIPEGWDNQLVNIVVEGFDPDNRSYIWVDNVSVEEFNYCECVIQSGAPYIDANSLPIENVCYQGCNPWEIEIDNATSVSLSIYDRLSNLIYSANYFDASGLTSTSYSFFQLWWDGVDNNGNYVAEDTYNYILTMGNCNQTTTLPIGDITVLCVGYSCNDASYNYDCPCCNLSPQVEGAVNDYNIPTCCPQNDDFEYVDFGGQFIANVSNDITIGETGIVSMDAGCNAEFYAGNSITIGPNTVLQPGNGFVHLLVSSPCSNQFALGDHRPIKNESTTFKKEVNNTTKSDSSVIGVYPNPSDGKYKVTYNGIKGFNVVMKLIVSDLLGNIVYSATENSSITTFDLSGKSSGVYVLKVIIGTKEYIKKLVKV